MKAPLWLMIVAFFCLPTQYSRAQTAALPNDSVIDEINHNICYSLRGGEYVEKQQIDAPSPVRTLEGTVEQKNTLTQEELELYQKLGLSNLGNGSYGCLVKDPDRPNRQYTIFKVKKIDRVLVVSTFLDEGEFITGQQSAATQLFLEMINFYTEIPQPYYSGIKRYFQEFYQRIADGRIVPSSNRTYAIDEPAATIAVYHPLRGNMLGTGLSLNIPLSADIQD